MNTLINELKKFSSLCWYPSAGTDFRELLYLSPEYEKITDLKIEQKPDGFILTDYWVMEYYPKLEESLIGPTELFNDGRTVITALNGKELSRLSLPFYNELISFEQSSDYGRVFSFDVKIYSDILGEINTHVIYAIVENTSFAIDFLLKHKINVYSIIHVRYGHMLGGGRSNGMYIKRLLTDLNTHYFISDMNYDSNIDSEALSVYRKTLKLRTDPPLTDMAMIPSYQWSWSGDVHVYKNDMLDDIESKNISPYEVIFASADENMKLYEIFLECAAWFARCSIDELSLSTRAYNCLSRYMDPPLAAPTGCHWTIDELLELTIGELKNIRNLGRVCCIEILEKLDLFLKNR